MVHKKSVKRSLKTTKRKSHIKKRTTKRKSIKKKSIKITNTKKKSVKKISTKKSNIKRHVKKNTYKKVKLRKIKSLVKRNTKKQKGSGNDDDIDDDDIDEYKNAITNAIKKLNKDNFFDKYKISKNTILMILNDPQKSVEKLKGGTQFYDLLMILIYSIYIKNDLINELDDIENTKQIFEKLKKTSIKKEMFNDFVKIINIYKNIKENNINKQFDDLIREIKKTTEYKKIEKLENEFFVDYSVDPRDIYIIDDKIETLDSNFFKQKKNLIGYENPLYKYIYNNELNKDTCNKSKICDDYKKLYNKNNIDIFLTKLNQVRNSKSFKTSERASKLRERLKQY